MVKEFIQKVLNDEIDIEKHILEVLNKSKKLNEEYNYFNIISEDLALEQAKNLKKGALAGVAVSVKDCICVKGVESRAGSKILSNYKPLFDATVIERIKNEGGIIIGKTAQDAFGFGSFSTNVGIGFKVPLNPFDKARTCGGSSGGGAGLTQAVDFPHIALAESTGGSIVNPACFCGVYGLCPTYGRVSRYGLIDYANSLDKIGAMGKTIEDIALMLNIIAGYDIKDSTSLNKPVPNYLDFVGRGVKKLKVALIKESLKVDEKVKDKMMEAVNKLHEIGVKVDKVSLPLTNRYGIPCYYIIAMCEASTNLARYCGMRYGKHEDLVSNFDEYFSDVRSKNFNEETKRRIILGTFARMTGFREAYYIKAMKVRTKIIIEYKKALKRYDALISPTMPIVAPRFDEIEKLTPLQIYMMDFLTVGPNLAGLPHLNVPIGLVDKLPVGMLLIGDHLNEGKLIQLATFKDVS